MRLLRAAVVFLAVFAAGSAKNCPAKKSNSKLFCYYSKFEDVDCSCSHVVLPAGADVKAVERARGQSKGVKILVTVNEFNQGLIDLLKSSKIDGLEINLQKLDSKEDISDFISTVKSKIGTDLYLALSVPAKAELLAKYYDFKALSKHTDAFILQTAFLGASKNVTFHPSRLSGLWDMQNTDSIVDLVSGLGAPLSKVVIAAPVQAFRFTLQNEEFSAPGSPALELKSMTRNELCDAMSSGTNWTLERDEDQAGPYIFSKNQWIAFEDSSSIDIKAKYSRVRGLAGLALKDLSQDGGDKCGPTILEAAHEGLSRQARAPRGAVLHSLEREIQESTSRTLDSVQLSPYRIARVIDTEGHWHVIRQDTRTEFTCSRQGYFVHPRSCNRFYRCVKFDQRSDEFSVFEFDCPAGLAFDERVEVCVWPGSLPEGKPCAGSSEIAPVPKERFICPHEAGYYADPENCRWFFACMDQGDAHLTAYEFRCPYGLVYDSDRLLCEWPWLVPKCSSGNGLGINLRSQFVYGSNLIGLDQYDGLGTLGLVKLGGVSGHIQQPLIYSNIGALGSQHGSSAGFGTLGYNAQLSLKNAGLLKTNIAVDAGIGQYGIGNAAGGGITSGGYVATGALDENYHYNSDSLSTNQENIHNYVGGAAVNVNTQAKSGYSSGEYQTANTIAENGASSYQYNSGNLHHQAGIFDKSSTGLDLSQGPYQAVVSGKLDSSENSKLNTLYSLDKQNQDNVNAQLIHEIGTSFGEKVNQEYINANSKYVQSVGVHTSLGQNIEQGQYLANQQGQYQQKNDAVVLNNIHSSNLAHIDALNRGASGQPINVIYQRDDIVNPAIYQHNLGYAGINTGSDEKLTQNYVQYQSQNEGIEANGIGSNINSIQYKGNTGSNYAGTSGATSSASFVQYHGTNQQEGVAGNINIVGGGYSAVGASRSGVEITNNGENYDGIIHTTASPVTVTTYSSVPTVTSVPLPSLKTATGFASYNGGVVANVPEYQLRLDGGSGYSNLSTNFVKLVSTTPSTLIVRGNDELIESEHQLASLNAGSGYNYQTSYSNDGGYIYDKPNVVFEEGHVNANKAVYNGGSSYSYQTTYGNNGGYVYDKPQVVFNEGNVDKYTISTTSRPAVTYDQQNIIHSTIGESGVSIKSTPKPIYQETPLQVYSQHSTAKPVTIIDQNVQPLITIQQNQAHSNNGYNNGFIYQQPSIKLEEKPQKTFSYSTTIRPVTFQQTIPLQPVIQQTVVSQPAASFSYRKHEAASGGYAYEKPSIAFEDFAQPQRSIIPNDDLTIKSISQQPQVFISTTVAPTVQEKVVVQPTSSYSYIKNEGYTYQKPVLSLSEVPVYQEFPKEKIISRFSIRKPSIEQSYIQPTVSTYTYQKEVNSGYNYDKPSISFEEKPISTVTQPTPAVSYEQHVTNSYVQPAVVSSYFHQKPAVSKYSYKDIVQQAVVQKEQQVPTYLTTFGNVHPTTPKTVYLPSVTVQPTIISKQPYDFSHNNLNPVTSKAQYLPPVTLQPAVVSKFTYQTPTTPRAIYSPASTIQPVLAVQQPAVVSSYNNVAFSTNKPEILASKRYNVEFRGYDYPKPNVAFVEEPTPIITTFETRKPAVEVPFVKKTAYVTGGNEYQHTYEDFEAQKENIYNHNGDTAESYFKSEINGVENYPTQNVYIQTTSRPTYSSTIANVLASKSTTITESPKFYYFDSRLSSTPKSVVNEGYSYPRPTVTFEETPIVTNTYLPPTKEYVPVTTRRPIIKNFFSTALPAVVSTTTKLTQEYLPVTTSLPEITKTYLPVRSRIRYTTYVPETDYPSSTYLPVRKYSTAPSLEYLPVRSKVRITTTGAPQDFEVTTRRPAKIIKVIRPNVKTIIKQNDIHPILSAKLGAQCTCTSNNLKLRKNQKIIIVEDNDDDDDGYAVENNYDGNTDYESQKLVDITPNPQIYVKSTTNGVVAPIPDYNLREHAFEPVTDAIELFVKKDVTPAPSDKEIADAVRTGLKLVKQAAKEGAREGAEEAIRSERVRDTIECQRAGLFRHPNQCNKFYACRWDCTKNKFTLHTFNCPVHLTFDSNLGACNWPSQGPACMENTLLPSA